MEGPIHSGTCSLPGRETLPKVKTNQGALRENNRARTGGIYMQSDYVTMVTILVYIGFISCL